MLELCNFDNVRERSNCKSAKFDQNTQFLLREIYTTLVTFLTPWLIYCLSFSCAVQQTKRYNLAHSDWLERCNMTQESVLSAKISILEVIFFTKTHWNSPSVGESQTNQKSWTTFLWDNVKNLKFIHGCKANTEIRLAHVKQQSANGGRISLSFWYWSIPSLIMA